MIAGYYQYNQYTPFIEDFVKRVHELRYRYYASEIVGVLMQSPDFDLDRAVKKAIAACRLAGIPAQSHFTGIYRCEPPGLSKDWKLSELACSFIIITCDTASDEIKEIQDAFIRYLNI